MKNKLRLLSKAVLVLFIGVCITLSAIRELHLENLYLLILLMIIDVRLNTASIPMIARKLPVKWWQIFFFDEKRQWAFSYTRTVCSALLSTCFIIVIKGIIVWKISDGMVLVLGSMFTIIAALLGIKRGTEVWQSKRPPGSFDGEQI